MTLGILLELCHVYLERRSFKLLIICISFVFPQHTEGSGSHKRSFQNKWLTDYAWLAYSKEKNGFYCVPCVFFSKGDKRLGKLVNTPGCSWILLEHMRLIEFFFISHTQFSICVKLFFKIYFVSHALLIYMIVFFLFTLRTRWGTPTSCTQPPPSLAVPPLHLEEEGSGDTHILNPFCRSYRCSG